MVQCSCNYKCGSSESLHVPRQMQFITIFHIIALTFTLWSGCNNVPVNTLEAFNCIHFYQVVPAGFQEAHCEHWRGWNQLWWRLGQELLQMLHLVWQWWRRQTLQGDWDFHWAESGLVRYQNDEITMYALQLHPSDVCPMNTVTEDNIDATSLLLHLSQHEFISNFTSHRFFISFIHVTYYLAL